MEWVDIEHRKLVGVIDSLSWTFGNTVFALIAYFVNDWRWLIVSVTSPLILAIITWRYDSSGQQHRPSCEGLLNTGMLQLRPVGQTRPAKRFDNGPPDVLLKKKQKNIISMSSLLLFNYSYFFYKPAWLLEVSQLRTELWILVIRECVLN